MKQPCARNEAWARLYPLQPFPLCLVTCSATVSVCTSTGASLLRTLSAACTLHVHCSLLCVATDRQQPCAGCLLSCLPACLRTAPPAAGTGRLTRSRRSTHGSASPASAHGALAWLCGAGGGAGCGRVGWAGCGASSMRSRVGRSRGSWCAGGQSGSSSCCRAVQARADADADAAAAAHRCCRCCCARCCPQC